MADAIDGLQPAGDTLADLDTPVPIVDLDVAERNLRRWQDRCNRLGLANRPHIKTHKSLFFAARQIALGAVGLTCQKIGEAEVMADVCKDIFITYNILGDNKLARLAALARRTRLSVVADSAEVVEGLGRAASRASVPIGVSVECDTGGGRCGVPTPEAAAALARFIASVDGLTFRGLMTYPKPGTRAATAGFLAAAKSLCAAQSLDCTSISTGGSPDMWSDDGVEIASEYRAGTYIFNDRSLVSRGVCGLDDCALSILTTVVSQPTPSRAIIDAGTKSLTSDLLGLEGHGLVRQVPSAQVVRLDEEHGYLELAEAGDLRLGDRLSVVPNHACVAVNLFDKIVLVQGNRVLGSMSVEARGKTT